MSLLELIIDFHKDAQRQGPGSDEATKKALSYIPELNERARILDIGCGTGAQTIVLAENTKAKITAIDMLPQFIEILNKKISNKYNESRIDTHCMSMDKLEFEEKSFDVIWSEGAIYNIGFEKGLSLWKNLLKDNGHIVISEISWLTSNRPSEIEQYWLNAYGEIDTIENKLAVLEKCGYTPITYFSLDETEWINHYYQPILERTEVFLEKHNHSDEVKEFVEAGKIEAEMYERFKEFYSYVFYIAKK